MLVEWPDVYILKLTFKSAELAFSYAEGLKHRRELFGFRFISTGPCDNLKQVGKSVYVKVSNTDGDRRKIENCAVRLKLTEVLVIQTWHFTVAIGNKKPSRVVRQMKNLDWVSVA